MAGKANFSAVKGDTFIRNCTFRNKSSLAPVNLTGATISGKVNGLVVMACSITNPSLGQFRFSLSSTQSNDLKVGINKIEVQVTYADLTVTTLFSGNLVIEEQFA